jgi:hypothetical protein
MWTKVAFNTNKNAVVDNIKNTLKENMQPVIDHEVQKLDNLMMTLNMLKNSDDQHLRGD